MKRGIAFLCLLLGVASFAGADDYDVTITLEGAGVTPVPLFKCAKDQDVEATDTTPAVCKTWDPKKNLAAFAVRFTNLGKSVVWVYTYRAKVPLMPGEHIWQAGGQYGMTRGFVSGESGGVVHVFASSHSPLNENWVVKSN